MALSIDFLDEILEKRIDFGIDKVQFGKTFPSYIDFNYLPAFNYPAPAKKTRMNLQVEEDLKNYYSIYKTCIDIKNELDNKYYIEPKRKGEISNMLTNILQFLDPLQFNKKFITFGFGSSPSLINQPIYYYLDYILKIITPLYEKSLISWQRANPS